MITYEQALKKILENTYTLHTEKILVEDSLGRVLKEDVYSGIGMPPFDKSAVDGYAVRHSDFKALPVRLKCTGIIQAGEGFDKIISRGECVKIMTGAPLPCGTDSVVMVENTRQVGAGVEVLSAVEKGENVCFQGEDLKKGQKVLGKNTEISSSDIAILATAGRRFIKVMAKPRVAILNTGGEIIPAGAKLAKNKIYNSNGPMLCALLKSDNIRPHFLGIAKDRINDLRKAVRNGLNAGVLLISGGVSMGDYDLIPGVLRSLGVKEVFHKVNVKPGKPLFFGTKDKTLIFGIPGNPVSNFLAYFIFVRPAIQKMMGYKNYRPEFKQGVIEKEFYARPGRRHFILAKISKKKGLYFLSAQPSHGSADTLSLSRAGGFMVIDENAATIKKGAKIEFITWKTI